MSAVPISLADLIQLSRYAQNAGTETQYIALSLEWAAQAQHEINRLTAELKQDQGHVDRAEAGHTSEPSSKLASRVAVHAVRGQ